MSKNNSPAELKNEFHRNGTQIGMRNPFNGVRLYLLAAMVSAASLANAQCPTLTGFSSGGSAPAQVENSGGGRTRLMTPKQKEKFQLKMQAMSKPYQFREKTPQVIAIADAVPDTAATVDLPVLASAEEAADSVQTETADQAVEFVPHVINLPCHTETPKVVTYKKTGSGTTAQTPKATANKGGTTTPKPKAASEPLTAESLKTMSPEKLNKLTPAQLAMVGYHRTTNEICNCPQLVENAPPAPTAPRSGGQLATITLQ